MTDDNAAALAWPEQDSGPPPVEYKSRPRDDELPTRRHMGVWDRIKLLFLLALLWAILVWASLSSNPILSVHDAIRQELHSGLWLVVLFGLEVLRQIHFLIAEHVPAYHKFWNTQVFQRVENGTHHVSDYTRYRMGRVVRIVLVVVVLGLVLSKVLHRPFLQAYFA